MVRLRGEMRAATWRLLDFGERLGQWRGKCLHNAVLGVAAARLFDSATNNLVSAVEKRAKELYG